MLGEDLKIIYNKVYKKDKHIASIRFNKLIIISENQTEEILKHINHIAIKLNLEVVY